MTNDYSTDTSPAGAGSPGGAAPGARSRLLWFAAALAFALFTARLGVWQLSRAYQKQAAAALIAERGVLPPLPAAGLARDEAQGAAQWQRRIALQGQWDTAHTVFLMNRTMDERAGFFVLTPLRLPSGDAVVVQRGWAPRDDADPMKPPAVATPAGVVCVQGRVAPWPSHWIELGRGVVGPVRQNLEPASFSAEAGVALRPVTVVEDATADNAHDGLLRDWAVPDVGVATNYGYAAQWFAMSVASLALYVWLQFFRRRTAPESSVGA